MNKQQLLAFNFPCLNPGQHSHPRYNEVIREEGFAYGVRLWIDREEGRWAWKAQAALLGNSAPVELQNVDEPRRQKLLELLQRALDGVGDGYVRTAPAFNYVEAVRWLTDQEAETVYWTHVHDDEGIDNVPVTS